MSADDKLNVLALMWSTRVAVVLLWQLYSVSWVNSVLRSTRHLIRSFLGRVTQRSARKTTLIKALSWIFSFRTSFDAKLQNSTLYAKIPNFILLQLCLRQRLYLKSILTLINQISTLIRFRLISWSPGNGSTLYILARVILTVKYWKMWQRIIVFINHTGPHSEDVLPGRKRGLNRRTPAVRRLLPVESVTDLDHDKHGQGHRLGMRVIEHFAIDALKALVLYKALHVMRLRSPAISESSNSCSHALYSVTYITETRNNTSFYHDILFSFRTKMSTIRRHCI